MELASAARATAYPRVDVGANSAKHELVRLLAAKLKPEGIDVGEVVVTGLVKGTPFDSGNATLEASTVGAKFWELYQQRSDVARSSAEALAPSRAPRRFLRARALAFFQPRGRTAFGP